VIRARLALAAALAFSATAWAAEPQTSLPPGHRPAAGSVEDELWYATDRAEKELLASPQLVRDPALNAYVRGVACKVAAEHCKDLRVYIADVPHFNAYAAPNGMVVVWTGTLLRVQDEAELAAILGHEFAHYREQHVLEQWRKAKRTSAFLATFGLLTYGGGIGIAGTLAGIAGAASMFNFSREKEREADRLGFASLMAQGYDPAAGARLWERMVREEKAPNNIRRNAVFATHPRSDERLADLRAATEAALAAGNAGTLRNREAYHDATCSYLQHWLEGELSRRMFATSIQLFADLRPLAEADEQATYAFFQAEAHRRRGKEGDLAIAERLYAEAVSLPAPPNAAWREHGLVLRSKGMKAEAAAALRRYLELEPAADDAAFIQRYLTELETTP
jgi:predicted Zn-dependent protease